MNNYGKRLYVDALTIRSKMTRWLWNVVRILLFLPLSGPLFRHWRVVLLRIFGAKIGRGCRIESSCNIWWPANLRLGDYVCLAKGVDCYNVDLISIGDYSTVSQRSFLCTASHSIGSLERPLVHAPISVSEHVWIAAEAYVGPGVSIGDGAVLGVRAVATKSLSAWSINVGVPAKSIGVREVQ